MQQTAHMNLDSKTGKTIKLSKRDQLVIEIAKQTAVGMRKSAKGHNIRRAADYVDALTFSGLLVQKNLEADASGDPIFIEVLEEMAPVFKAVIQSGHIRDAETALADMRDEIGIVDQNPAEMLINLGLTAEGVLLDLAQTYDLTKRETMQVLSFAIVFALIATTPEPELEAEIQTTLIAAREKIDHWDEFIPSDEDMFGDLLDAYEDDEEHEEDEEDGGDPKG